MDWARTEHSVKGALFAIDFAPDNGLVELSFHNDRGKRHELEHIGWENPYMDH